VIDVLSRLVSVRGAPAFLRSDNGPEFVSMALLSWIVAQGIGTALIEPGKPWQNGVTESLNGKFRDECLSLEWFRSRAEAKGDHRGLATALQPRITTPIYLCH
jgi:putative transposase